MEGDSKDITDEVRNHCDACKHAGMCHRLYQLQAQYGAEGTYPADGLYFKDRKPVTPTTYLL